MSKVTKKELSENAVFSIYLEGVGYTVAQLRDDCQMEFFDVLQKKDEWCSIDLNKEKVVFCIVVAAHRLLKLFHRNISSELIPNSRERVLLGLSLSSVRESTGVFGLKLIKYDKVFDPNDVDIIINDLEPVKHKDILYSFELMSMNGSADKIRMRLERYFNDGINFDDQIRVLYPEIDLPPKKYERINVDEVMKLYNICA